MATAARRMADEFTVVAWDEPGAGRSSDVRAGFGLADYADCLATLIEALARGPAHVAGISWGGTVVQELYRHHPELVATLVLVDTYAGWRGSLPPEEVRARVTGAYRAIGVPAEEFDPARALPGWFAGDPPAEFVPLLEEMAADVRPESLRAALRVMSEADQRDLLPRIAAADAADLGGAGRALAAQRRAPVRTGDPGNEARRHPRRRSRQQPRAARAIQRRCPQVLPRSLDAFALSRQVTPPTHAARSSAAPTAGEVYVCGGAERACASSASRRPAGRRPAMKEASTRCSPLVRDLGAILGRRAIVNVVRPTPEGSCKRVPQTLLHKVK